MNSTFKSFMALSLILGFACAGAMDQSQNAQNDEESTSTLKVALTVLGTAAVVYGGYKVYQNQEAIKNALTLENVKALPGMAKDTVVAGYNGCTLENGKSALVFVKDGVVSGLTTAKDTVIAGYNDCTLSTLVSIKDGAVNGTIWAKDTVVSGLTLDNAKTYSGYNWIKGLFSKSSFLFSKEEIELFVN